MSTNKKDKHYLKTLKEKTKSVGSAIKDFSEKNKNILVPGLAGAGAGGLLGSLLTSSIRPGENSSQRRKRLISNALVGAALGGATGTALPLAYRHLKGGLSPTGGMSDKLWGLLENAGLTAGGAAIGGVGLGMAGNKLVAPKSTALTEASDKINRVMSNLNQGGWSQTETGTQNMARILGELTEPGGTKVNPHVFSGQGQTGNLPQADRFGSVREIRELLRRTNRSIEGGLAGAFNRLPWHIPSPNANTAGYGRLKSVANALGSGQNWRAALPAILAGSGIAGGGILGSRL
jgi:hypothetical protein